ncbi:O-antigen ligase family protein [Pelagibacterales bacterium SAG-MED10]|nr:O-antigen ligase family protein [Pelagibacterales bacterium SAG-MED10]
MSNFSKFNNDLLIFLILIFPIIFFFRSLAINIISALITLVYLINISSKQIGFVKNYNLFLLIFSIIILIISTYLAFGVSTNFYKSIFLLKIPILLIAIIQTFSNLEAYKFSKKYLIILSIFFLVFMLDIMFQFFFGKNIFGFKPEMCNIYSECARFGGMFKDELISGGYISFIIIPFFLLINKFFTNKYIKYLPIFLLVVVILTGERSATLLTLLFCISYYYIILNSKKNRLIFFTLLIIGVLFTSFLLPAKTLKRYSTDLVKLFIIENESGKKELNLIENNPWSKHYLASIYMFKQKPFLGNGLKSFRINCVEYEKNFKDQKVCTTHPHNFYLEVLVDAGLLGFLPFVLFFILLIYLNINKLKYSQDRLILIYLIIVIFLPRPTGSIFSTYFLNIFIYSVGLLVGIMNMKTNYKNEEKL